MQRTNSSLPLFHDLFINTSSNDVIYQIKYKKLFCLSTASLFHAVAWLVSGTAESRCIHQQNWDYFVLIYMAQQLNKYQFWSVLSHASIISVMTLGLMCDFWIYSGELLSCIVCHLGLLWIKKLNFYENFEFIFHSTFINVFNILENIKSC